MFHDPPAAVLFAPQIDGQSPTTHRWPTTPPPPQGKDKPVIMKALVELDGPRSQPFQAFVEQREKWMLHDMYRAPGAIQFYSEGARNANMTLMYELLGDKAKALTQCDLSETVAPAPVAMGASKFLYRPATKAIRSHVEQARLDYEPKVPDCLKSRSLEGVELEADERSQSSKQADRGPLERMFPGTYGARLLQVRERRRRRRDGTCAVSRRGEGAGGCSWSLVSSGGAYSIVCFFLFLTGVVLLGVFREILFFESLLPFVGSAGEGARMWMVLC